MFIDGKLAAANLSFEGKGPNLQSLDFFSSETGDTLLDEIGALKDNMLFPDADKDGLPDAWEIAYGSNPNLYDRDNIKPGTGKSFLDSYMDSLWPNVSGRGGALVSSGGSIPALELPSQVPVGSLKGSLSVGGDGAANYSIPIDLPKGTAGMEPKLGLSYSSNTGNGPLGVGWTLTGLQRITRGPSTVAKDGEYDPVDFDPSDRFFLDGERLICVAGTYGQPGSEYRTEIDSYARIIANGSGSSIAWWTVETKAGLTVSLGAGESEIQATGGTLAWCVNRVQDTKGNYYTVEYAGEASTDGKFDLVDHRVSAVHYTGNGSVSPYCHVLFDYDNRPDQSRAFSKYSAFKTTKRLTKIRVLTGDVVNHAYRLAYQESYQSGRSLLYSVTKHMGDLDALAVPSTTFSYDGIKSGEALWLDPGNRSLPVYGSGLDASSEVNSMVDVMDGGATIRLIGDVARAYKLPGNGVNLDSQTRISFDFKSTKLVEGAIIGLDADTVYQGASSSAFYRIGGNGSAIKMADGQTFSGPTKTYSGSDWVSYDLPIGSLGSGARAYLVLMCVDHDMEDGVDTAWFRNVRIYQSGGPQPSPLVFDLDTQLPRYADADGKDLGVRTLDLDADGLPDLSDWRAFDFDTANGVLSPQTGGNAYRNIGDDFLRDLGIRPLQNLPLSVRSSEGVADDYESKHHLVASPVDVDGDGRLDLLGSVNIKTTSGYLENEYAFYSMVNGVWTEKTGWKLPFGIANTTSSTGTGGKRRDEHFQWMDLNVDGYPDLVVYTTSAGYLYDPVTKNVILAGGLSTAYLNKGRNGPGWVKNSTFRLPVPLMEDGKDVGRRLVDLDGDGFTEIAQARYVSGNLLLRTHFFKPPGYSGWYPLNAIDHVEANHYDLPTGLLLSNDHDRGVLVLDLNGDGMPDVLRAQQLDGGFSATTWLNQGSRGGDAWNVDEKPLNTAQQSHTYDFPFPLQEQRNKYDSDWRTPFGFQIADINGDGLQDILYSDIPNTATSGSDNLVFRNTGDGWEKREAWGLPASDDQGGYYKFYRDADERFDSKRRVKLEDLNGDGFPDLITGLIDLVPRVWYNNCRPEVLTSVTDGFGSEIKVEYRRLNDPKSVNAFASRVYTKPGEPLPYGHTAVVDSRLVVSRYAEPDGVGGFRYRSQRYGDLRYDRINDVSLGFGWIEALDELTGQLSRTDTRRDYPFAGSPDTVQTWVDVGADDVKAALIGVVTGKKRLTLEKYFYSESPARSGTGGTIRRPVQTGSEVTKYDLVGTTVAKTTTTQVFGEYGFVTESTVLSLDGSTVVTSNTYDHTTNTKWQLGRLRESTVTKSGGGKPTLTRSSAFTYDDYGLLLSETIEPDQPAFKSTKTYGRDSFGNITSTTLTAAGVSRASTSTYNPASPYYGRFLTSETNALGHTVTCQYDATRALLSSTTDANGLTTVFDYDTFGTLTCTNHPDGTQTGERTGFATKNSLPSSVRSLVPDTIKYFRAKQGSGMPIGKVYLDALGRELVTETRVLRDASASGSSRYAAVYSVTRYDNLGHKIAVSDPFFEGESVNYLTIAYDLLSRTLSTTFPGTPTYPEEFTEKVIQMQTVTVTLGGQPFTYSAAKGRTGAILERWEDQHGRLVQSMDDSGQTTVFTHDQDGRLLTATVGGVKLLENTYDLLGNKKSVWEANSGTSSSEYNAIGEVTSTTNAKGQTTSFTYDKLGRPITTTRPEGVTYTIEYDPAFNKGKPCRTTGTDGTVETVLYDGYGRPITTTTTRATSAAPGGETFVSTTTYDALGRVQTTTDAGGLMIVNDYDPQYSFPVNMRIGPGSSGAGTALWTAGTFNSKGKPLTQNMAQGVALTSAYHPMTGQLESQSARNAAGAVIQNKSYQWSSSGNLITREDGVSCRKETFGYDPNGLNRLYTVTTAATVGSTNSTVPGTASYGYDLNGNLRNKAGASLLYEGTRPHAVSSATLKGVGHTYEYDAAGYMTKDKVGTTDRRTFGWTSFGQLRLLDYQGAPALQNFAGGQIYAASRVQTDFEFDSGGSRARQMKTRISLDDSRKVEETLYLGSYERETHLAKASASAAPDLVKTVHRHSIGGFAVYTRTEKPGLGAKVDLSLILKDHLGSTDVILTGTWNGSTFTNIQTERQSFDAWGERRNPETFVIYRATDTDAYRTSAQDYDRGYTGHEQLDDSGLIHMNGRIYDPELGRMLSPDPYVQVPEYSQNFNRYSYVLNNPLNLTDPTGFSWLGNAFHKMGSWLHENWRTVVSIVVAVVLFFVMGPGAFGIAGMGLQGAQLGLAVGAMSGAFNAAIYGGGPGDILKGAVIGGIGGAITGGVLSGMEPSSTGISLEMAEHVVGHGLVGGASNVAMGGKFGDGFLAAAVSAGAADMGAFGFIKGSGPAAVAGRTLVAGVVGGTASSLGGGKFANGAWTAAFQHLLNAETQKFYADAKAKTALAFLEKADPRLARMINDIKTSRHGVSIYLDITDADVNETKIGGYATSDTGNLRTIGDLINGKGLPYVIHAYNGNRSINAEGLTRSWATVLAHELQHAWDGVNGTAAGHLENKSYGVNVQFDAEHEFRAVRTENIIRGVLKLPIRSSYGGMAVPNYEEKYSPQNR